MTPPAAETIRTMPGRAVLSLGVEWFRAEGRACFDSIEVIEREYGPAAVGEELRVRAASNFALATLLETVRIKAERSDARREDGVFASLLVGMLRSGFTPRVTEASKNAA